MTEKVTKSARNGQKRDKNGRKLTVAPSDDVPMRRFIDNVPNSEFLEALEASPDPKIAQFLAARADPAYADESFSSLCRRFKITLQDVDDIWRKHQLHTGMIQMMTHVPQVLVDVAEDAKARLICCPRCEGIKSITDEKTGVVRTCAVCEGAGKLRVAGDKAARDLVFESIGLTGKRSPLVAIQQNFGLDTGLEELLLSSQKVLTGDRT